MLARNLSPQASKSNVAHPRLLGKRSRRAATSSKPPSDAAHTRRESGHRTSIKQMSFAAWSCKQIRAGIDIDATDQKIFLADRNRGVAIFESATISLCINAKRCTKTDGLIFKGFSCANV